MTLVIGIFVVLGMIALCYFTSGLSNNAGTIFERKSTCSIKSNKK